ncbi:cob(I)yrinic acid a,c-diamide adenosyltransferase [Halalkalibacterium halodurans]|uniref:Corrinoid adenosyltransferase n=1 Tax=Halalkalibacterium halodurans (strain ATCC BAA-125 / DSM 18197 / FERM 7344 / JCM 9153 / C-125) TaxID=272558 RepID=Q9KCH6_HALH5|nr:cob(I)yrinic acid a,c-diamide adenosyltransferase [Halalkalibacterium halodurans]MED4081832.1 cob(I)yrinic acid a,c-diamide adenosyltransferase [Halalkalibacterium halodurans]MED4086431.1 cob(I)yrinic acid a,c-diamide adenosyltransferase [Halalkalibacterium halodurans]MED4105033.1 cob(I)yrinic acid a,c-diamide adenosyltransferase [Halalkalibacterium halodurans]MED4110787.1 cob(I)yrinic acid a,c-diamide adenosyltransferase [Halalkalibacterium halodurans]MED4125754.1 cob(I)yrinic acid a,c-dia
MRLYTRTGDKGKTSVIGGRLAKDDTRVVAYGTTDELNSFVGLAITQLDENTFADIRGELFKIQHELFDCGGDLAMLKVKEDRPYKAKQEIVDFLEQRIDAYIKEAPELERFILPGGSEAAASLHVCRTIARRAERYVVRLQQEGEINPIVLKYLNRLSDYFFAVARVVNSRLQVPDVEYERSAIVFREGKRKEDKK